MKQKISILGLLTLGLFASYHLNAQTIGGPTGAGYVPGLYVNIGVDGTGGFEGADTITYPASGVISGLHPRSNTQYMGFVANPAMSSGWTTYDGDFFTPGTPENGWGIELGSAAGTQASNNRANPLDIPGSITGWAYVGGCYVVDWEGDYVNPTAGYNLHIHIKYELKEDELFYKTSVFITNNGTTTIPEVYYYRNVDPDNNVVLSGSYTTTNTIVSQPTGSCSKALVSATQTSPTNSYMGFAALGPDYRVCYGGFSNRDASDLWNAAGFTGTVGSTTSSDIAISLSHRTLNLDPGETTDIKFVVILDASQVDEALNSYMEFEYIGALADPPSCITNVDTAISCSGNPLTIEFDGSIENEFTWTWSPATGLDTAAGNLVHAFPSDTTLYTITGVPINPCFTSNIVSQIVVIPAQGPEILMTDPGIWCYEYDLNNLVFSDQNGIPGTTSLFVENEPLNAVDTNVYMSNIMYPGDSIYLFISEPTLGCYDYQLVDVEWSNGFNFDADVVNPICAASNGSIEIVNITGNVGAVTYQWSGGGPTTPLYGSIPSGTYTVTMEDEAGCIEDTTINFPNITTMFSSVALDAHAECSQNTGAFTVTATSGSPAYGFDIGTGIQPTGSFSGLAPGLYVIEITDQGGCLIFDSIIVPDTSTINLSLVSTGAVYCGTSDGDITVSGSGGLTPYTYTMGSVTQTTPVFDSLSSGTYTIFITGVGGCQDSLTATVVDSLTLSASVVDTTTAICGSGGAVEVTAVDGGASYTYTLGSSSNATGIFSGLTPGTYNVTVTSGTCTDNVLFTIADNNTLNASLVDTTSATCGSGGAVEVTAVDGGASYTYTLGSSSNATGIFSSLAPGTYNISVTSGTCTDNVPFTIADNQTLTATLVDTTSVNCDPFGAVEVTAANGAPSGAYTFTVPGYGIQTNGNFTGLPAGSYTMTVASGTCTVNVPFTIASVDLFNVTLVDTNAAYCSNSNGSVLVTAANGASSGIYVFTITGIGSQSSGNFTGMPAGSYIMTVTSGTCSEDVPFVITNNPGNLTISLEEVINENCGSLNGLIETQATGGTTPYAFSIDGFTTTQPTGEFAGLDNGSYTVEVSDVNGCLATVDVQVAEIPIDIELGDSVLACNSYVIEGNGVGDYLWSTGETSQNITVNQDGMYWLMVSRPGCMDVDTVNVSFLANPIVTPPNVFTPNGDGHNDKFVVDGIFVTTYNIKIFNRWGQEVFSANDISQSWDGTVNSGADADEGVYMYIIEFENPCESPSMQTRHGSIQLLR